MKKITVSKLCQACQISRSTFYLHYDNVEDLTDDLEKELLYRVEKIFRQEQSIPLEEPQNRTFLQVLDYIEQHTSEFLFFTGKPDGQAFTEQLAAIAENSLLRRLQSLGCQTESCKTAVAFVTAGVLSFMLSQIRQTLPEEKEAVCTAYNELLHAIFKQQP